MVLSATNIQANWAGSRHCRADRARRANPAPVERLGTPGMATNLWGVSPLYENENLKVGSIPTVTPIGKVLEACNRICPFCEEAWTDCK